MNQTRILHRNETGGRYQYLRRLTSDHSAPQIAGPVPPRSNLLGRTEAENLVGICLQEPDYALAIAGLVRQGSRFFLQGRRGRPVQHTGPHYSRVSKHPERRSRRQHFATEGWVNEFQPLGRFSVKNLEEDCLH